MAKRVYRRDARGRFAPNPIGRLKSRGITRIGPGRSTLHAAAAKRSGRVVARDVARRQSGMTIYRHGRPYQSGITRAARPSGLPRPRRRKRRFRR